MSKPIRLLVVDDSPIARHVLRRGLQLDPQIEVVGAASGMYEARDMIVKLRPDVLTLDLELPDMDGVTFLTKLMPQYPLPVVVVSSLGGTDAAVKALEAGAVDVVAKPSASSPGDLDTMIDSLRTKVKLASTVDVSHWKWKKNVHSYRSDVRKLVSTQHDLIVLGASTGGVEALQRVLTALPPTLPPIVIVQHIPFGFCRSFAKRLDELCASRVKIIEDGELLRSGQIYVSPGDQHACITGRRRNNLGLRLFRGAPVSGHCPSVDVLFESAAEACGPRVIGALLTGMGRDGANGLLHIRERGGRTAAQSQDSCVVYGMPKAAYEIGAAEHVVDLNHVAGWIFKAISESNTLGEEAQAV